MRFKSTGSFFQTPAGNGAYTVVVVKSSRLPVKFAIYLVSIGRLLCLAFLYGWRFLNKISLNWPLTFKTQPSTSKLSDNPDTVAVPSSP